MIRKQHSTLAGALALAFTVPAAALAAPLGTDFDGDGRADLAFHRPDGSWSTVPMLRSTGEGWLSTSGAAPSFANQKGARAIAGDFNGDKRADLAFYNPGNPGSPWTAIPVLLSTGAGTWTAASYAAPAWANAAGAIALAGDFNGDKRTDLAFHNPGSSWTTVPVLLSTGTGWTVANYGAPSWANQLDVIALAGDFDGNGRTDLAFHRPGGGWTSLPLLISKGDGSWTSYAPAAPSWASEASVTALAADFDGDGRSDLAFHRPGSTWSSVPLLRGTGAGGWLASNYEAPAFANASGAIALAGDYNGDGRADLAFTKPDGVWTSVPVLLGGPGGSWTSSSAAAPTWANQPGMIAVAGDYNGDGRADLAFHRPDGAWTSVPVLYRSASGTWTSKVYAAPAWANQLGARALIAVGRGLRVLHPGAVTDGGDPTYDQDAAEEDDWADEAQAWLNFLRLFVLIVQGADEYIRQSGLNGHYDGTVSNGHSSAAAYLELEHHGSSVHGRIIVKEATLRLDGGFCSDVTVPVSALQVNATSSSAYHAAGATTRSVTALGIFSGSVDVSFDFTLETTSYTHLNGTVDLDVPWPCANQALTFHFARRPLL
jgi:FG-GAP-like repeat